MTSSTNPPDAFTSLPAGRQATPPAVGASRGPELFIAEWIAKPAQSSLYVNPPRPDYGPQYNGVGECPF